MIFTMFFQENVFARFCELLFLALMRIDLDSEFERFSPIKKMSVPAIVNFQILSKTISQFQRNFFFPVIGEYDFSSFTRIDLSLFCESRSSKFSLKLMSPVVVGYTLCILEINAPSWFFEN